VHGRIGYGASFAVVYLSMAGLGVLAVSRASRLTAPAGRRSAVGPTVGSGQLGVGGCQPAGGGGQPVTASVEHGRRGSVSS
jgi:hypothetical protein